MKRADDKGLRLLSKLQSMCSIYRVASSVTSSYRFHPECFALVIDIDEVKARASRDYSD